MEEVNVNSFASDGNFIFDANFISNLKIKNENRVVIVDNEQEEIHVDLRPLNFRQAHALYQALIKEFVDFKMDDIASAMHNLAKSGSNMSIANTIPFIQLFAKFTTIFDNQKLRNDMQSWGYLGVYRSISKNNAQPFAKEISFETLDQDQSLWSVMPRLYLQMVINIMATFFFHKKSL